MAFYGDSFSTITLDFKLLYTIKNYRNFTVNTENTP